LTHNINPACGSYKINDDVIEANNNKAVYQQVYDSALMAGLDKTKGTRVPKMPL
jgi:hypothetical protein